METFVNQNNPAYTISTDKQKLQIEVIHQYLSVKSYWAKNIPLDVVRRSIDNSFCFGLYYNDAQVGFARLVTDKATFAYLADVFILPEHRGAGLSKWLMTTMMNHPDMQGLRRWLLGTLDAHGLYEQFGWTRFTDAQTQRFMQLHNPNAYNN
ncbi:GNAT family N-acetyltransferase [Danxiaibacter flavus]|uniref:GNAT family N-acetyltransferase n=1 Tax=Danxiaibacter flavus TaxID=3049108 RepID=A0ABV3ZJF1_9BACT|nr:GNAT family N-acetyltransferase [Chitinophagaceae bacterium DXS]